MSFTHGSHNMFITVWLFISPFIFKFSFGVYKQYTQLISTAIAWNFTGIWHMAYGCLDIGYFTKYTSGISYILMEIPTYSYHVDGTQVYASYFILILYDCALMSTHFHCIYFLYTVYTVCWHSHMGFHVYEMYTYATHLPTRRYIMYTTCIHRVSLFYRLVIRPLDIYTSLNATSSYCPSRLRMLACG